MENRTPSLPVLLVDDDPNLLQSASLVLRAGGIEEVLTCNDARRALEFFDRVLGAVVLDLSMPHRSGRELLVAMLERDPDLPVLMLTGESDLQTAIACMRDGAVDYLVKPVSSARLVHAVKAALEKRLLRLEVGSLRAALLAGTFAAPPAFMHLLTRNREMLGLFRYLDTVARTTQPLLLSGETGTGKRMLAEAAHRASGRQGSFIGISVAGMDDATFAETLFGRASAPGHVAQTGALQAASNGTLFIDDLDRLSDASQAALIHVIRDNTFSPVGSFESKRNRARLIAAMTIDRHPSPQRHGLSPGLRFRFQRELAVPPLRRRREDLRLLVPHFLESAAERLGMAVPVVPPALYQLLGAYDFPANVLELARMCEDALARHTVGNTLALIAFAQATGLTHGSPDDTPVRLGALLEALDALPTEDELCHALVLEAMRRAGDNQSVAAPSIGLTRRKLGARLAEIRERGGSDPEGENALGS